MHLKTTIKRALSILPRSPVQLRLSEKLRILQAGAGKLPIMGREDGAPRILIIGMRGDIYSNLVESFLAIALNLRGAHCQILTCDAALSACNAFRVSQGYIPPCESCVTTSDNIYGSLGLRRLRIGRFLKDVPARNLLPQRILSDFNYSGINIGAITHSAYLSFLLSGTPAETDQNIDLFARMLRSAGSLADASSALFSEARPDIVLSSHGFYLNWGVLTAAANQAGIPVYIWGRGYRLDTLVLTQGRHWQDVLREESDECWLSGDFNTQKQEQILRYLRSRSVGSNDFIQYNPKPLSGDLEVAKRLGLDLGRPVISMFPNIAWDASGLEHNTIFNGMNDWLVQTVQWFGAHQEVQLVIRAHPAEVRLPVRTRDGVVSTLQMAFGDQLPSNVTIVAPNSPIDSYALARLSAAALVFSSKLGMELPALGIPVVVAGRPFYKSRGFTVDPPDKDAYFVTLGVAARKELKADQVLRAQRYAHYFFFRRYVPFDLVDVNSPDKLRIRELAELLPGRNRSLDWLCSQLLSKQDILREA